MYPLNIFVGVPQSKYAGIAILISLVFVAFAMIFGKDQVPVGQKFLFVLIMFVVSLPSILFLLFQLTCLVTGAGAKNQRWWCAAYAWIGTIFVIIYSVIIVLVGVMSLVNGTSVTKDIDNMMSFEQMKDIADTQAREYFTAQGTPTPPPEPTAKPPDAFTTGSATSTPSKPHEPFTTSEEVRAKDAFGMANATSSKPADGFANGSLAKPQDPFANGPKPEGFTGSSVSDVLQKFVNGKEMFIDVPQPPQNPTGAEMGAFANVPQPASDKKENFALLDSLNPLKF